MLSRLLHHLGREAVRQVVLADDDLDVDAEIVRVAEHLDNAAHGVLAPLGVLHQFHVDDHAVEVLGRGDFDRLGADAVDLPQVAGDLHALGNLDPVLNALVVRHDGRAAPRDAELADDGGMRALEDAQDFAVGAAVGLDARDAHHDAVAVHGLAGGIGGDEDIAGNAFNGAVRDEEAVAVAVHAQPAGRVLAAAPGGDVMAAAQLDDVAARGQARQGGLERSAVPTARAEFADQLFEIRLGVRQAGDVFQQVHVGHIPILANSLLVQRL